MYLALDVETSGLPHKDLPRHDPSQPVALEVSALLFDEQFAEVSSIRNLLVRVPEGVSTSAGAESVHGISRQRAARYGVPDRVALALVTNLSRAAQTVVAYSASFDRDILCGMLERNGHDPAQTLERPRLRWIDVMHLATPVVGLKRDDGTPRWPKLTDSVRHILGREHEDAHRSFADAMATWELYVALQERGHVPEDPRITEAAQ